MVKQVVASAVDDDGNQLHPRSWPAKHIDAPSITRQHQPCLAVQELEKSIKDAASDQERVLYCVLAGSGLRIAEALAIRVSGNQDQTSWSPESAAIDVRSSIFSGREIPRLKTVAARRTVDLDPRLSDLIAKFVEINRIQLGDYLFQARSGRPAHLKTVRQRLAKHKIAGFHSFRRFRITRLREQGVPEDILRFWVGHEGRSITDHYSKLGECAELRKQWGAGAGLGFELPDLVDSTPHGPRRGTKPTTPRAEPASPAEEVMRYQATDDDLPTELFGAAAEHAEQA